MVAEGICGVLCGGSEIGAGDSEALEEGGGDEERGVGFEAELELGFGWEREDVVGEGVDFGEEIFGDSMVDDLEEAPFSARSA